MNFAQYFMTETTKTEAAMNVSMLNTGANNERIELVANNADPNIMTGRVVNGIKYCIFHQKYINLTELANQVRALYISKGYMGTGFSKLKDEDFVKYASAKTILKKLFDNDLYRTEIDCKNAAKYFLAADYLQY